MPSLPAPEPVTSLCTPGNPAGRADGSATPRPILPASGQKELTETDFADSAAHGLSIQRTYRSPAAGAANASSGSSSTPATPTTSLFGPNWSGLDVLRLQASGTGASAVVRIFTASGGQTVWRAPNAAELAQGAAPTTWVGVNTLDRLVGDPANNPAAGWAWTAADGGSRAAFDAAGRQTSATALNGWTKTYAYNAANQLTTITNAFGRSLALAYNAQGWVSQITPPDGQPITYSYDSQGRLVQVTYPNGTSKSYLYELPSLPNAITGVVDEAGNRSTYSYDSLGRAIVSQRAGGLERYSVSYPASGAGTGPTTITDPLGTARTYTYAAALGRTAVVGASAPSNNPYRTGSPDAATRSQNPFGLIDGETDFLGVQTLFTWDTTRGLPTATTRAAGRPEAQTTQTQWHATLPVPLLVTEPGRTTAYTYDALGNALTQTITDTGPTAAQTPPRTWAWAYNAQGLPSQQTDPLGRITTYGYDAAGNLASLTNPLGHVTTWQYDAAGRPTREVAPNGLVTTWAYDVRGRVTTINRGGEVTTLSYTPTGQVAQISLPTGQVVSYSYDVAQRLTTAQDNRGARISYSLDAMGNRVGEQVQDATQANAIVWATSRTINALNRVAAITSGTGNTSQFGFDANGETVSTTDPLNQSTRTTLDALRRPTATTFADNAQATQAWSALNEVTQVTDPKGIQTSYTRNAFGEVLAEQSPDTGAVSYVRDGAGRITQMTDARGVVSSYSYDAIDRVTRVSYAAPGGTNGQAANQEAGTPGAILPLADQVFSYDAGSGLVGGLTGGSANQTGYLSSFTDASGSTAFARDLLGRITEHTVSVNDNPASPTTLKAQFSYGPGGLVSGITYPSGLKLLYRRNAQGQITAIDTQRPGTLLRPQPVRPFVQDIAYNALGQVGGWNWVVTPAANPLTPGVVPSSVLLPATRSYDTAGRMTANELAAYTYDAAGRITGITQQLYALRSVATANGTVTQGFFTPITWAVGYDNRNRVTRFARDRAEALYTFDVNGNRTTQSERNSSDTDLDNDFDNFDVTRNLSRAWRIDPTSNRLLGFNQTSSTTRDVVRVVRVGSGPTATTTTQVVTVTSGQTTTLAGFANDAAGNLASDSQLAFAYDAQGRLAQVTARFGGTGSGTGSGTGTLASMGESAQINFWHNALGQRTFKSEPKAQAYAPDETQLGPDFVTWLRKNFGWLFDRAQANATLGQVFLYAPEQLAAGAPMLLGEYGNGAARAADRTEYLYLPSDASGNAASNGSAALPIPIGIYRSNRFWPVHTDHLATPRLMRDEDGDPVWQWPYSAFGDNKPIGPLRATANPRQAFASVPGQAAQPAELFRATGPQAKLHLRYPGQYFDEETKLSYNYFRSYDAASGRYTQPDPIGLEGGLNRFGYVGANALSFVDPFGLQAAGFGPVPSRPAPRLPPSVESHIREMDPSAQLRRESPWPDPMDMLGPKGPESFCWMDCSSQNSCPAKQILGVPRGDGCFEVCARGPFADAGSANPQGAGPRRDGTGSRSATPGDVRGLLRTLGVIR